MHLVLTGVICFAMGLLAYGLVARVRSKHKAIENAPTDNNYDNLHRELVDTKDHLQLLFETMSDGLITVDANGTIVSMNHMAQKITGYNLGSYNAYLLPELRAAPILGDCIERRIDFLNPNETQIQCADGSVLAVEMSIRVVVTEVGQLFVVTIKDISEFKRTQKLLLQQSHIIEKSESFVLVTDKNNLLEWCNPRFESLTGYQFSEMIGQDPCSKLICDSTSTSAAGSIRHAVKMREPYNAEILLKRKDGALFWAQFDGHPMFDEQGNLEKYVSLGFETTERKYAQQMQVDFVSMVSHELRTPLTVIAGAFEALMVNPRERTAEIIDMMVEMGQRNCVRLEKLIEDLLDINKIEGGTAAIECKDLIIGETIAGCVEEVRALAAQSRIDLNYDGPNSSSTMFADPLRVAQIMSNLLSNAIKFSSAGSSISVDVRMLANSAQISVQDNGRGIPAEFRPMVFKKFARDPGVEADGTDGFGLGLSICEKLVAQMNGKLDFESEEGVGTRFFFELPYSGPSVSLPVKNSNHSVDRVKDTVA